MQRGSLQVYLVHFAGPDVAVSLFEETVVGPMDAMWATFTDEERDYWNKVNMAVKIFDGRIV